MFLLELDSPNCQIRHMYKFDIFSMENPGVLLDWEKNSRIFGHPEKAQRGSARSDLFHFQLAAQCLKVLRELD
jgi:hypothetical protein